MDRRLVVACVLLFALFNFAKAIESIEEENFSSGGQCPNINEDPETMAVKAAVKIPVKCKETKYKKLCKFYSKIVPKYDNVELWRLKDQTPMVTFYGIRGQVVDDVPVWMLPQDEWEIVLLDAGMKMKPEHAATSTTPAPTTRKPKAAKDDGQRKKNRKENREKTPLPKVEL